MQGPQQVQDEYANLLKPMLCLKPSDITSWVAKWEDRATKLVAGSEVYRYPDQLRRQIFY